MEQLSALIGNYYGLDWGVLLLGVLSTHCLTSGRLRVGFSIGIFACMCGFAAALLSGQNGFIVYNLLLIALNIRGIMNGDRRQPRTIELPVANDDTAMPMPQAAPAHAHAR